MMRAGWRRRTAVQPSPGWSCVIIPAFFRSYPAVRRRQSARELSVIIGCFQRGGDVITERGRHLGRGCAAVLGSRADAVSRASPSRAWSSTKPSSITASLRRLSWNLTVGSITPHPLAAAYHSTWCRAGWHHPDRRKDPPSAVQQPELAGSPYRLTSSAGA